MPSVMALQGVLARSIIADFIILFAEGFAVLSVALWGVPPTRGFSCADYSIRQPFRHDTISTVVLGVSFIIGVILLMIIVDICLVSAAPSNVMWRKRALSVRFVNTYRAIVTFLCGAGLSQLVTDIAKYHVGALRPHFIDVCEPNVDCKPRDGFDPFEYITEYACLGPSLDRIKEARVSFPSGHANISFYSATFFVVYLQYRMSQGGNTQPGAGNLACFLSRPLIQGMALLAAWFTTISRVMDNMHHFRDVTAGGLLGVVAAILIIRALNPFRDVTFLRPNEKTPLRRRHTPSNDLNIVTVHNNTNNTTGEHLQVTSQP